MSPASRSKSKDKSSARAAKDQQQKACSKPSPQPANGGSGIPASAYNPLFGTFHTLETSPTTSPPPAANGRFRTIDETDVHSGSSSLGTGAEYDSVSNTGSCSGESEDQKDKTVNVSLQSEPIPGAENDKREKIRQRNERKHQRQKERRAHELHEKCSGYLMSRKLEALAQQLVAMGFSSERATMALILNEGRVEESVAWLFDGGEEMPAAEQKSSNLDGGGNLKIDIAEELARISDMENRFKCTKQEVERVVVACEGDLDRATETLRVQKQELVATQLKLVETGDPPTISNFKLPTSSIQSSTRTQLKAATASVTIQHRKDERDFNYIKVAAVPAAALPESENRSLQSSRKNQPKLAAEWVRPQQQVAMLVEKKRSSMGTSSPSISCSLASSLRVALPPTKSEPSRLAVGSTDGKNVQAGRAPPREPVIMMQRPQSINATKQNHPTTSLNASPPITTGWYQNSINKVDLMKGNGAMGGLQSLSLSATNPATQQHYLHQTRNHPYPSNPVDSPEWGSSWNTGTSGSSSSLAVPSSLGLFTGWGSTGASGPSSPAVDWSMGGSMPQCDYTNIDWSLEATSSSSSRRNGSWTGVASYVKNSQLYDGGWSMPSMVTGVNAMRLSGIAGWQEGSVAVDVGGATSAGSHEWASPFAGNDLFGVSRQSATSPTL